jgi:hypothetical protein
MKVILMEARAALIMAWAFFSPIPAGSSSLTCGHGYGFNGVESKLSKLLGCGWAYTWKVFDAFIPLFCWARLFLLFGHRLPTRQLAQAIFKENEELERLIHGEMG